MDFTETEKKAYSGEYVDYDSLDGDGYKYFTRIAELGRAARAGQRTPAEITTLRNQYFSEYNQARAMRKAEIIKFTESFRVHINGSDDPVFIAALALRCLWELTGDSMLEKKMLEVESRYESKS